MFFATFSRCPLATQFCSGPNVDDVGGSKGSFVREAFFVCKPVGVLWLYLVGQVQFLEVANARPVFACPLRDRSSERRRTFLSQRLKNGPNSFWLGKHYMGSSDSWSNHRPISYRAIVFCSSCCGGRFPVGTEFAGLVSARWAGFMVIG
jgi:hypothetical protein